MASLTIAYILWLFGGIFGLHHLYLNRPQQCFIWLVTWGGMVLGWLTEVTQLKNYVDEANDVKEYRERMKVVKIHNPKPGFSIIVLGGQLMIGHQLGNLLINALPEYYTGQAWYGPYLSHVLAAAGASIGVTLASNIGPQEAPLLKPLLASVATFPTAYFLYNRRNIYILLCVVVASFVTSQYSRWAAKKNPINLIGYLKICFSIGLGIILYGSLWTSNMYHNAKLHTLNGTRIPLRDAVYNFAKTQPWDEAREVMFNLIPCLKMYSLDTCQYQILSALTELSDPQRDAWAFSVLGFDRYPSQKQINSHCRKLSSKWHPDRFMKANETEKDEAERKFIDIQKACLMLNKMKSRRERKNIWSDAEHSETIKAETDNTYAQYDDVDAQYSDVNTDNDDADIQTDDKYTHSNNDTPDHEENMENSQTENIHENVDNAGDIKNWNTDTATESCNRDEC